MKRRRARRRSRSSAFPIVALLLASIVVAVAVTLIVRGDTSSRGMRGSARHHDTRSEAAAQVPPAATVAPAGTERRSTAAASNPPLAEPSEAPEATTPEPGATASPPTSAARLAIIIDDCGQWPDTEHGFIALPYALTLSVLPHVRYTAQIARDAEAAGKGVMLHLPMEPLSGADPGPGRIMVSMNDDAIVAQVRDDLASVPLAAGVNNHEGSRATADDRVMRAVAGVLAERRLFFIDSRTDKTSIAARDTSAAGVPTAGRDVFLDNVADVDATEAQLRRAAHLAKSQGSAIAIGHPRPTTLIAVRTLLPELQRDGIQLVLARELVR